MKKILYKLFIWIAGSDPDLLDSCNRSEHIKHAGTGGLILIPTTLAFISGTYAISTLDTPAWIYFSVGFIWAVIIFCTDRYMVSSFRKGENLMQDLKSASFIMRFILAVFLGIIISHPLVLRLFDGAIQETLNKTKAQENLRIDKNYQSLISIEHQKIERFTKTQLSPLDNQLACLRNARVAEGGGVRDTFYCSKDNGALITSGKTGTSGPLSAFLEKEIRRLENQRDSLSSYMFKLKIEVDSNILKYKSLLSKDIRDFNRTFSKDYIKRNEALEKITNKSPIVRWTTNLIILFFIILDVLVILFKALTKKGEYDFKFAEREKYLQTIMQYYYQKELETKGIFIDNVSEFKQTKILEIFANSDDDHRSLTERLNELNSLTNLKWEK